jgi:hypothetical protein
MKIKIVEGPPIGITGLARKPIAEGDIAYRSPFFDGGGHIVTTCREGAADLKTHKSSRIMARVDFIKSIAEDEAIECRGRRNDPGREFP